MYIEQYRHSLLYISNHILEWEHKHNNLVQYIKIKTDWDISLKH